MPDNEHGEIHQFGDGNLPISTIMFQDEESEQSSFRDENYLISRLTGSESAQELLQIQMLSSMKKMKSSLLESPQGKELVKSKNLQGADNEKPAGGDSEPAIQRTKSKSSTGQGKNDPNSEDMIEKKDVIENQKNEQGRTNREGAEFREGAQFGEGQQPKNSRDRFDSAQKQKSPYKQLASNFEEIVEVDSIREGSKDRSDRGAAFNRVPKREEENVQAESDELQKNQAPNKKLDEVEILSHSEENQNLSLKNDNLVPSLQAKLQNLPGNQKIVGEFKSDKYPSPQDRKSEKSSNQSDALASRYYEKDQLSQENDLRPNTGNQLIGQESDHIESSNSSPNQERFISDTGRLPQIQATMMAVNERISSKMTAEPRNSSNNKKPADDFSTETKIGIQPASEERLSGKHPLLPKKDTKSMVEPRTDERQTESFSLTSNKTSEAHGDEFDQGDEQRSQEKMHQKDSSNPPNRYRLAEKSKETTYNTDKNLTGLDQEKDAGKGQGKKPDISRGDKFNIAAQKDLPQQELSSVYQSKPYPLGQRSSLDTNYEKDTLPNKSTAVMTTVSPKGKKSETEEGGSEPQSYSAGEELRKSDTKPSMQGAGATSSTRKRPEGAELLKTQDFKSGTSINKLAVEGLLQQSPKSLHKKRKTPVKRPPSGKITFMEDPRSDALPESSAGEEKPNKGLDSADEKKSKHMRSRSKQNSNPKEILFSSQKELFKDQGEIQSSNANVESKQPDDSNEYQKIKERSPHLKQSFKAEESNFEFSPESARFYSQDELNSKFFNQRDLLNSPSQMGLEKLLSLALESARLNDSHIVAYPKGDRVNQQGGFAFQQSSNDKSYSGLSDNNLETLPIKRAAEDSKTRYPAASKSQKSDAFAFVEQMLDQHIPEQRESGLSSRLNADSHLEEDEEPARNLEENKRIQRLSENSEKRVEEGEKFRGFSRREYSTEKPSRDAEIGFDRGLVKGPRRTLLVSNDGHQEREEPQPEDDEQGGSSEEEISPRYPTFDVSRKIKDRRDVQASGSGEKKSKYDMSLPLHQIPKQEENKLGMKSGSPTKSDDAHKGKNQSPKKVQDNRAAAAEDSSSHEIHLSDANLDSSAHEGKKYSLIDAMLESSYQDPVGSGRRFKGYEEEDEVHQASSFHHSSHHQSPYRLLIPSKKQSEVVEKGNEDQFDSQGSSGEELKEEYRDDVEVPTYYKVEPSGSVNSVEGEINTPSFATSSPGIRRSVSSSDSLRSYGLFGMRGSFFPNSNSDLGKRESIASQQIDSRTSEVQLIMNRLSSAETDSKARPTRVSIPIRKYPAGSITDTALDEPDLGVVGTQSTPEIQLFKKSHTFDKEALEYISKLYGKKYADCLRFCYVLEKLFEKRTGISKAQAFSRLMKRGDPFPQEKPSIKRAASSIQVIPHEGLSARSLEGRDRSYTGLTFPDRSFMLEPRTLTNLDFNPDTEGWGTNVKFYWILDKIIGRRLRKNKGFAFDRIKHCKKSRNNNKGEMSEDDYFIFQSFLFMLQAKRHMILEHTFTQMRRDANARHNLTTSQIYMSRILDQSAHHDQSEPDDSSDEKSALEKSILQHSQLIQKHEKALAMLVMNKLNDVMRNLKRHAWTQLASYKKKQNRHTYHPTSVFQPITQSRVAHHAMTVKVKSHPNLDSLDIHHKQQDRKELLRKIISWKIEDEELIKNRYLTLWKFLADVHKIRSQKILNQLQNVSKVIRRYLFKLFVYRLQYSAVADDNKQNLIGHYVGMLRKRGFEALSEFMLKRKKTAFQAILKRNSIYKSLKAETSMQKRSSNILFFAQLINYLFKLNLNRQLSSAFSKLRQVKYRHATVKRMVIAIDNLKRRAAHRAFEIILKSSKISSMFGKVKTIEIFAEKIRNLRRKRMKWAFNSIIASSSQKKYKDYAAKIAMLEQCINRYTSQRLKNALGALELHAIHKKNKILATTHMLLKIMLFKDYHETNLKEYAFEMIRMIGEEASAKISNKNYGYTNGLYKLHYLILAVEFKRYRTIVSQMKESQMQTSIALKIIEKLTRKTSRKLMSETFKLISEKDADSSTRSKKLRIKRMINSIMKNLPVFMRMENILSKKRKECLSASFNLICGQEARYKPVTLDTMNYVAQKIIKRLLFKRYVLCFEHIKHTAQARSAKVALTKLIKIARRFARLRVQQWRGAVDVVKQEEIERGAYLDEKRKQRVFKEWIRFTKRMAVLKILIEENLVPTLSTILGRSLQNPFNAIKQRGVKLKFVGKSQRKKTITPENRSRDITPREKSSFVFDSNKPPTHHNKSPSYVSVIPSTFSDLTVTPRKQPFEKGYK